MCLADASCRRPLVYKKYRKQESTQQTESWTDSNASQDPNHNQNPCNNNLQFNLEMNKEWDIIDRCKKEYVTAIGFANTLFAVLKDDVEGNENAKVAYAQKQMQKYIFVECNKVFHQLTDVTPEVLRICVIIWTKTKKKKKKTKKKKTKK